MTRPDIDAGKPLYEVSQMTTAIMLVEAGLGVGGACRPISGRSRASREVVSRPLIEPQVTRNVYLIQPDSRSLSPAAEGFARTLRQQTRAAIARSVALGTYMPNISIHNILSACRMNAGGV